MKQGFQRRCDRCIKVRITNTNGVCQLYCTMKRDTVGKFDHCKSFFYGRFDKGWVK